MQLKIQTNGTNPVITIDGEKRSSICFKYPREIFWKVECLEGTKQGNYLIKRNTLLSVRFEGHGQGSCPIPAGKEGEILSTNGVQFVWVEPDSTITYTSGDPTVIPVGGVKPGSTFDKATMKQMWTNLLYDYVKPEAKITTTPEGGLYEFGNGPESVHMVGEAKRKSKDLIGLTFYANGVPIYNEIDITGQDQTIEFDYVPNNINVDTKLTFGVSDGMSNVYSSEIFEFCYPYFYGAANSENPTEEEIKSFTKVVAKQGEVDAIYTCDSKFPTLAIPASWEPFLDIYDENGFCVTNSFKKQNITMTMADGKEIEYRCYVHETMTTVNRFNYYFTYIER